MQNFSPVVAKFQPRESVSRNIWCESSRAVKLKCYVAHALDVHHACYSLDMDEEIASRTKNRTIKGGQRPALHADSNSTIVVSAASTDTRSVATYCRGVTIGE